MKKFFIHTFGCQANKADSERIAGDYSARGYVEAKSWKQADEIVINTCSVRQSAEDRVRGMTNNIQKYVCAQHKRKPKVIITGCMTHFSKDQILERLPYVDEVLPIGEVGFNTPSIRRDKKNAWIPISSGCNSFCTYCIVPFSRGREQSRPFDDVVNEAKTLAKEGYTEITLLGQNVNSYGLEKAGISLRKMLLNLDKPFTEVELPSNQSQYKSAQGVPPFVTLLQTISAIPEIKMIRFLTSNPWDFHDELIKEIAQNPKIDRYLHLPIQSGSNRVLKLMNRGYTREDYIRVVEKIRAAIPDVVLGTDIIVGFPTETEADFQDSVDLAKQIDWKIGFVARYSPRPGTAASRLYPDDISDQEKKRRWDILDQIINKDNMAIRPFVIS
jgi:tRNA-2-methylthio-N6-dimethylallyladenosine synthase